LVASNTLPGRFPGSGMFMNTLSGSLTFSRHRKNPYFSPSHHPTVLMSQSVASIPNHHLPSQQAQPWFDSVPLKPTSNAVSLGNLHSVKPQPLPHPPPAPIPPPPDLDLLNSDTYTMQQSYQFPHHQQQNRPASSVHTQNSASMSTRRQTLLSADTMTTNVSAGGQPSPSIAMGNRRVSTDVLGEGFVESPDVNQVFSATLPWKSKPQGGITVGLKRLSTFIRSAVSGSSASFHSHHSNQSGGSHPGQQTGSAMQTPGLFTKRQQFAGGGWPSGSFASSSATPAANSMGLLSSGQSRSSYTSEATLQPISPLSSLGRSSLGHISSDRKPQICLVDPSLCRLNHQHVRGDQQQTPGTTNGNAAVGSMMRRGNRESTPLPPLPPQYPHHSNSNSSGPSNHIPQHQETTGTITVRGTKGKSGTLNMDTYLEPIDGADPMGQQSTNAGVEDLSVTEIISGGTLSEDSDTGNQASWQSVSPDGANSGTNNVVVTGSQDSPQVVPSSSRNGITADCASGIDDGVSDTAPIAMSDPTVSLGDGSFDEDSSAADYFTYDEGRRSNARKKHNKVIRRPRLSPPSTRSRPLSDAMLSNHYYDKSELLSPDMIPGLDGAPEALFDPQFHDPDSRPTSVGVYSNDEEEVEEDEDSSLYEAVDRRARKVGTLPPAPHPPPPPQISTPPQHNANTIEME
uniref:Non-specific serine/threonine protein kinase n=1 Tax=Hymenolepis diminuta TaxID=6216 RepID=A0A158QES1_HYMDI